MSSADSAISVDQDLSIVSSATMGSSAANAIPLSPVTPSASPPKSGKQTQTTPPKQKTPIQQSTPIKQATPVKQTVESPIAVSSVNKARTQANATSPLKNATSDQQSAPSTPSKKSATAGSPVVNNRTPRTKRLAAKAASLSDGSDRSDPSDDEDYSEYSPKSESPNSNAGNSGNTKATAKPASSSKHAASSELCPTPTPHKKGKKPTGTVVPRPFRRAPTFKGSSSAASSTGSGSGSGFFSSTVFEVHVGNNGFKAIAHEDVLRKSPMFVQEMAKARAKPQKVYQQIIHLHPFDKDDFAQMMDFLYKDKLTLRPNTGIPDRLKELKGVATLAYLFKLPELQRQITQAFVKCELLEKMLAPKFIDFAEDMFYRQTDPWNGPWTKYFLLVAPGVIKAAQVKESRGQMKRKDAEAFEDAMCSAIWLGSGFAITLYRAQNKALKLTEDNFMNFKVQKIKTEALLQDGMDSGNEAAADV